MSKELYSNAAIGFLSGAITSSTTSITLVSSTMFPATGNFTVKCDSEIMTVSANASNVLTVARGQEGTTAAAHTDNSPIFSVLTDGSLRRLVRQSHGGTIVGARRETNFIDGGGVTWTLADDSTNDKVDVSATVSSGYEASTTQPPASSTFSWTNQGTATVTDDSKGFYLLAPASSGNNVRILTITVPTAPYTLIMRAIPTVWSGKSSVSGIVLRDSSSGNFVRAGWNNNGYIIDKFTNATTFSALYTSGLFDYNTTFRWIKIQDDNTNRVVSFSQDGVYWWQAHTVSRTSFITPDQVGVLAESNDSSLPGAIRVVSWNVTNP